MGEQAEARSENARHVILRYENRFYHVDMVTVQYSEIKKVYDAVFRAKRLRDNQLFDLSFEISQRLYDVLVEYAKLGNPDLLLVLDVEGEAFRWRFVSESWLRQQVESKASRYVV